MDQHTHWFEQFRHSKEYEMFQQRPIVYFCAEFAIAENTPTYAGGLGILAGDILREASDQQIPLVAIGLYYHEGYLHHELYSDGTVLKHPMRRTPQEVNFHQVLNETNQPLIVTIPIQGRQVAVTAWEMQQGTVRIFLLDTDLPQNDANDRNITNRLYITNKETRFKQEMILGIAGLRILEALKIHPFIYHLNEGHSALLALELAHHEMDEYSKGFMDELERTKQHIVFTNHTLLSAGNDTFNNDMVSALLSDYAEELRVPVQDFVSLGLIKDSSIFSMTMLALRMASRVNAVSKLHAKRAADIWPDHPMIAVTNGIHIPTWDKMRVSNNSNMQNDSLTLWDVPDGTSLWNFDSKSFWNRHQQNKRELLEVIQKKAGQTWNENDFLIGWGRRIVGYKRPLALFQDKERLFTLLKASDRPVRIVIAGSAHESDIEGAEMLEELQRMIVTTFDGYVVYVPNYNLELAEVMTAGCDTWLNTPVVGFEACGTSGMKACLNGVLPCTTKDGWEYEVELYGIGWVLENDSVTESLLTILEQQILPLYYARDENNLPQQWINNMKNAREMILNDYSTTRMLREYIDLMYLQVLSSLRAK